MGSIHTKRFPHLCGCGLPSGDVRGLALDPGEDLNWAGVGIGVRGYVWARGGSEVGKENMHKTAMMHVLAHSSRHLLPQ